MPVDERRPWTQNRRFEFIEWKLFWEGALNRSDLEEAFEISTPQASVDLRRYRELAGDNIEYDGTSRFFRPTPAINPSFLKVSADRLLIQLRAFLTGALPRREIWFRDLPSVDMAPDIVRHVDAECLRLILDAIRTRHCVEVRYQSLTNSRTRQIAPHASPSTAIAGTSGHGPAIATTSVTSCSRASTRFAPVPRPTSTLPTTSNGTQR
jgi:hypothetical protein